MGLSPVPYLNAGRNGRGRPAGAGWSVVQAGTCEVVVWGGVLAVMSGRGVLRALDGARCCGTPAGERESVIGGGGAPGGCLRMQMRGLDGVHYRR